MRDCVPHCTQLLTTILESKFIHDSLELLTKDKCMYWLHVVQKLNKLHSGFQTCNFIVLNLNVFIVLNVFKRV